MHYERTIDTPQQIATNIRLLSMVGCTDHQIQMFKTRRYEALPLYIRRRLKAIAHPNTQAEPTFLRPQSGQKQWYVSPDRYPFVRNPKPLFHRQKPEPPQEANRCGKCGIGLARHSEVPAGDISKKGKYGYLCLLPESACYNFQYVQAAKA